MLAVAFGAGAALVLDEWALIFHLEDVYWSDEGRSSVDAVIIGTILAGLLMHTASPFGIEDSQYSEPRAVVFALLALNYVCAVLCFFKGKPVVGAVGLLVPFVAIVGAVRLAKPSSPWARWFYTRAREGSRAPSIASASAGRADSSARLPTSSEGRRTPSGHRSSGSASRRASRRRSRRGRPRSAPRPCPCRRSPATRRRALRPVPDPAGLVALRLDAAPHADERVLLPLAPDRRLVGVPGEDACVRRELHQTSITERTVEGPAADGVLEEDVAREEHLAVDDEGEMIVGVAGRRERLNAQPGELQRAGDDLQPELALVLDVVRVGVRSQDVARPDVPALGGCDSGNIGAPLSTKTATPPSSSATR